MPPPHRHLHLHAHAPRRAPASLAARTHARTACPLGRDPSVFSLECMVDRFRTGRPLISVALNGRHCFVCVCTLSPRRQTSRCVLAKKKKALKQGLHDEGSLLAFRMFSNRPGREGKLPSYPLTTPRRPLPAQLTG